MQIEMNQLLEMQTAGLSEKIDEAKRSVKDGKRLNSILNMVFVKKKHCVFAFLDVRL